MNAKKEKKLRKLYREICRRNNLLDRSSLAHYKQYVKDLKAHGMYVEFEENAMRLA